jgi:pyruvate/2-oxoglutarate dehydrogenase complex dihydrolipoamide dehydrogenase (E3) component
MITLFSFTWSHTGRREQDYVVPSPLGSKWGLGGTCVNVGCIPKKLFHTAGLLGEGLHHDITSYGWPATATAAATPAATGAAGAEAAPSRPSHNWAKLVENVQNHIKSLNFGYRVNMKENKVNYINALGTLIDAHTVETLQRSGKKVTMDRCATSRQREWRDTYQNWMTCVIASFCTQEYLRAESILLAVGGRPRYPDFPGAREHCITSGTDSGLGCIVRGLFPCSTSSIFSHSLFCPCLC